MEHRLISEFFEADHDRLDELFKKFQSLKHTEFPKAKESFVAFKFGLQRHIVWEEDVLFPLFENKTGMSSGGPTAVMRVEHRQIAEHLEAIHQKVQKADPNSDMDESRLLTTLSIHNQKEEEILYPAIDRMVTEADRIATFEAIQSIPEERYLVCCEKV